MTIKAARPLVVTETFDALRERIRNRYDGLSPHLQRIARLALDQPNQLALQTIAAIADEVEVQPSTLIRFAKEFGYDGFSSMQQVFKLRLIEGAPTYREQVFEGSAGAADARQALDDCVDALIGSLERLRQEVRPDDLGRAAEMCLSADHIYVAGLRRSRPIATYLAYGLTRLERRCSLLDFGGGMAAQQVANMRHQDLLVAIAFAPHSPPVVDVVRDAHVRGLPVLTITDGPASPLARHATLSFQVDTGGAARFRPISGAIGLVQTIVALLASRL